MAKTPETISHIKIGSKIVKIDAVTVGGRHLPSPSQYLPGVSNANNGKILMIRNGSWVLYSPFDLYSEYNGIDCGEQTIPIHDYSLDYLTFDILTTGTIGWKNNGSGYAKTISYSINDGEWTSITAGSSTINVTAGDVVRFKGENTTYAGTNENYSGFGNIGTSTFNVSGNIMSLVYGDNFTGQTTLSDSWVFCCMFDKSNVVSAENLILPATTLTTCCYRSLFGNCTSLTTAPVLPADIRQSILPSLKSSPARAKLDSLLVLNANTGCSDTSISSLQSITFIFDLSIL